MLPDPGKGRWRAARDITAGSETADRAGSASPCRLKCARESVCEQREEDVVVLSLRMMKKGSELKQAGRVRMLQVLEGTQCGCTSRRVIVGMLAMGSGWGRWGLGPKGKPARRGCG